MNGLAFSRHLLLAALGLSAAAPPMALADGALAVEGIDRARLLAPAGARVADYRNAGYRLRRLGDEISIEVDVSPLWSTSRFELPPEIATEALLKDPVERLARGLTAGVESRYQAVSRILSWVARHIEYELDRSQPQAATAVLKRRSGYCTGVARLTVALLQAVGIAAREVAGYVVAAGGGASVSGYHRWIEAYLPDRGWVFSDPMSSHHYVPATYVRLASEELLPERGVKGLLLERRDGVAVVDLYPPAWPGITARRNSPRRLAAALDVRLTDSRRGRAELTGEGLRLTHTLVEGGTTFVGLEPGRYRLRLLLSGGEVHERPIELPGRVRTTLSLPAIAAGKRPLRPEGSFE